MRVSSTLFLNEVLTLVNHLVYILMISLVTCLICGGIPFVILCLIIISVFSFCFLVYVFVFNFFFNEDAPWDSFRVTGGQEMRTYLSCIRRLKN